MRDIVEFSRRAEVNSMLEEGLKSMFQKQGEKEIDELLKKIDGQNNDITKLQAKSQELQETSEELDAETKLIRASGNHSTNNSSGRYKNITDDLQMLHQIDESGVEGMPSFAGECVRRVHHESRTVVRRVQHVASFVQPQSYTDRWHRV
ncbi:hypothetical protein CEXT_182181 [Caerostris extrusa]|uniref:Uncharacterized protein n=1 Tax=Caerostris extrusa TaxID=172846 RepID=A0AAV4N1C2_CAEEX|nr:hypothetical protein CEXT_182181 [Caerostris extrusa]